HHVVAHHAERRGCDEAHCRTDDWRRNYLGHPRIVALPGHLCYLAQTTPGNGTRATGRLNGYERSWRHASPRCLRSESFHSERCSRRGTNASATLASDFYRRHTAHSRDGDRRFFCMAEVRSRSWIWCRNIWPAFRDSESKRPHREFHSPEGPSGKCGERNSYRVS